jgi:flagellar biosynthesis protein FlhG
MREYTGRDLTVLGSIPDDPAIARSVYKFMPVVVSAPESEAAASFMNAAGSLKLLLQMITK